MSKPTQIDRFKILLDHLNNRFREEINASEVEKISFYSYRNINRIFLALQQETIGQYLKRLRLEKAAEFLKYANTSITDIAFEIGYSDLAAFSKAFKNKFNCSPAHYRNIHHLKMEIVERAIDPIGLETERLLAFEIEEIPEMEILYLEHQGDYQNITAIKQTWEQLVQYASKLDLIEEDTIFLAEVLDDEEITESIHCRYNCAIVLEKSLGLELEGFFRTKKIAPQQYAKFIHKGSHESCIDTYNEIYAQWMFHVQYEFADLPTLEFFLNDDANTMVEDLLTEIYIPIAT